MSFKVVARKTKTKMNVLYTSQKLQELFFDEKPPAHAHASGDGDNGKTGRCCRLCSGETNLRYFGDTYVWEGVHERYDQLLFDCFGVRVTQSDSMICEWCVRALRSTERFRSLVHAAFDQPLSDPSTSSITLKSGSCAKSGSKSSKKTSPKPVKEMNLKQIDPAKRREVKKRLAPNDVKAKRINIPCEICKHRYPMLVPNEGYKTFVCSRCKKNCELRSSVCRKCNIMMPNNMMKEHMELHTKAELKGKAREGVGNITRRACALPARRTASSEIRVQEVRYHDTISNLMKEHLELHAKTELRGKARARQPKKTSLAFTNSVTRTRPQKFQCSICPKKYAMAKNLALHVRDIHGNSLDNLCSVCGQNMQTKEKLEEHLAEHTGPQQCDECLLIFKNRKGLDTHRLSQHVKCNSN